MCISKVVEKVLFSLSESFRPNSNVRKRDDPVLKAPLRKESIATSPPTV